MKVLLNNYMPFMLAHGGAQIQIEQTQAALEKLGVEVEPLRWWDERQKGDVLHHFARIRSNLLRAAQAKGMKVVFMDFLTEQGSRPPSRLWLERMLRRVGGKLLPKGITDPLDWDSYRRADACLAMTPYEASLLARQFGAPAEKIHVVPNGVEEVFLNCPPSPRGPWLVCTATITERKRVLELAEAAVLAQTPLWVIGKPYSENDPYGQRFVQLARSQPNLIRYEGAVTDRPKLARIYAEARGFVLLSTMESLSLSALEASGCGAPLLLSDLPSSRESFAQNATYCPIGSAPRTAKVLSAFYAAAPGLKPPPKPMSWLDVARQLKGIYEKLLAGK
jgi:glycosyltransferase involved in cell wall biosynthesis